MEILFGILNLTAVFILGLFIKSFLPTYMSKKGENLATKEDIAEITKKTEEVKVLFQNEAAEFLNDITFTNEYTFNRYSILYSKIYGIIIQSEYIRYFSKQHEIEDYTFEDYPFLELGQTETKYQYNFGEPNQVTQETKSIENEMTSFNKKQLTDYIIKNSEYASPKLLKLAVAYRYTHNYYEGTTRISDDKMRNAFNQSEFELIKEIVKTIIIEYNEIRKTVKLSYSEFELENGQLEVIEFK